MSPGLYDPLAQLQYLSPWQVRTAGNVALPPVAAPQQNTPQQQNISVSPPINLNPSTDLAPGQPMRQNVTQNVSEQGSGTGDQGLPVTPDQYGQMIAGLPPVSQPQTPQNIEVANRHLQELQKTRDAIAEQMMQYHPSLGRRILAGALGAMAGLNNPQMGYQVSRGLTTPDPRRLGLADESLKAARENLAAQVDIQKSQLESRRIAGEERKEAVDEIVARHNLDPQRVIDAIRIAQANNNPYLQMEATDKDGNTFGALLNWRTNQLSDVERRPLPPDVKVDWPKTTIAEKQITAKEDVVAKQQQGAMDRVKAQQSGAWGRLQANLTSRAQIQATKGVQALQQIDERTIGALKVAAEKASIPPTQVRAVGYFASNAMAAVNAVEEAIPALTKDIGVFAGRWNDLYVNKIGGRDRDFATLDQNLQFIADEYARATNFGRSNLADKERYLKDFRESQDVQTLLGRLEAAKEKIEGFQAISGITPGSTPSTTGAGITPPKSVTPVAPPGVTLDEINKEIERRRKANQ
jgi:hypothetical protein